MYKVTEFTNKTHAVEIYYDEHVTVSDALEGFKPHIKVLYAHRRYILGDVEINPREFEDEEEMVQWLKDTHNAKTIMPLYCYEHGNITVSTGAFSCPWDSGQTGWVISTEENDEKLIEAAVKAIDMVLQNEVYLLRYVERETCDLGHEHRMDVDAIGHVFDESHDYKTCLQAAKDCFGFEP